MLSAAGEGVPLWKHQVPAVPAASTTSFSTVVASQGMPAHEAGKHQWMIDRMAKPLVADDHGNALAVFDRDTEGVAPTDAPMPAALVALWHAGRVLMVFDRFRQSWELPGGMIESEETPRQAATRELLEETGQSPDTPLRFVGYAGFVLAPDQRAEYAALFAGRITNPRGFRANDEISATCWWDLHEPLPGRVQPLDAYLARLTQDPN
ncbi:NUDIX domain-containing protein [Streptomyces sp. NPDC001307]|uniref:NUDIX domain-containing protein n=1 Tax=Streptomyces sp. NPDC001307 TaxID=3364560 RepID=UPI0036B44D94